MKNLVLASIVFLWFGPAALAGSADQAYKYSGTHAGGPANDLNRSRPVVAKPYQPRDAAYRYSGTHAGGPANDLIPQLPVDQGFSAFRRSGTVTSSTPNEWGNFGGPNTGGGGGSP